MKKREAKATFKISYFLRLGAKGKPGAVYIRSAQNSDVQQVHNTGVSLLREQWKFKVGKKKTAKQRKQPTTWLGGWPANLPEKLRTLEGKIRDTYAALLTDGLTPDLPTIIKHLDAKRKPSGQQIVTWCDDYLTGSYSDGQKKAVATLKSNLQEYAPTLSFDRLRKPQIKDFFEWLSKRGVANNSQHKRLLALRHVADHANIDATELRAYKLPYTTTNAMTPRLTWAEVKQVIKTDTKSTIEQAAKDVFLLSCFGGLRIEDILHPLDHKLLPAYYVAKQRKTKKEVYVTRHKYNEDLLKLVGKVKYSRQRLSDALDNVLDRAGLTDEVTVIRNVGHKQVEEKAPKYKVIAFHSGRRFYARLLNDLGLGQEIARDELGHDFKSVTERYAGSPEHALRISRVRKAMDGLEKKMNDLGQLMKVA